jgi:YaiO family outer membrane protein
MTRSVMKNLSISFMLLAGAAFPAPGQSVDPDVLFRQALALPKDQRPEAEALCRQALADHPDYHDVRIQLARYYAWDDQYDAARREIRYVLERQPENLEARGVAIDIEVWADRPQAALAVCDQGLALAPADLDLHYRKARILRTLGDLAGAQAQAETVLAARPEDTPARLLLEDVKELRRRSKVSLDYTYDTFNKTFSPWRQISLALGHRFDLGSVIATVDRADLFDTWGTQYELEAYPHLCEGTYAWLNYGRSTDSIFPQRNHGAEVYHSFNGGVEASLGYRHMDFSSSNVTLYTAMGGKYLGNALYSLRLYVCPSDTGTSTSGTLSGRWFGSDPDNYINASVGYGFSPDYVAYAAAVVTMHSRNASLGGQTRLGRIWLGALKVSWADQEFLPDDYRTDWTIDSTLTYRF